MSHILLDNVRKEYKAAGQVALDRLSLEIKKGEWAFLVGSSGAGKTTLLKLLYKALVPDAGSIKLDGQNLQDISTPMLRRQIGIIFQHFELIEARTAAENVAYGAEVLGHPPQEVRRRTEAMLERVGLLHKASRLPSQLSGGERQRVAVARALINEPKLILADEPTGELDPENAQRVVEALDQIHKEWGATVLFATHSVELVDRLQRRVIRLGGGRLVSDRRGGYWGESD